MPNLCKNPNCKLHMSGSGGQIGCQTCLEIRETPREPRYVPETGEGSMYNQAATLHTLRQIEAMLYKISQSLAAIKLELSGRE